MKKRYFLFFTLLCAMTTYGQTILTIIDKNNRTNADGPTNTGNVPNVSSVGFTRGAGIDYQIGAEYAAAANNAATNAEAIAENDYIQWSISANTGHKIVLSRLDIRLARRTNPDRGVRRFRIYYSTNNFATAGTPLSNSTSNPDGSSTIVTSQGTNYTYPMNVDSGLEGRITFRLFAWDGSTTDAFNSLYRVFGTSDWNGLGQNTPGARIFGAVLPVSKTSNIITTFDPIDNIDYALYTGATSGLTTANAVKIGEFTIQDGGNTLDDVDALSTTLTDLGLTVANSAYLSAIALFDNGVNVSEVTTVSANTNFTNINGGLGIEAADNSSKTFSVYATFNTAVVDNDQLQLTVSSATPKNTGSFFATPNAGGAATSIAGDDNKIEVIASTLTFDQQPSYQPINTVMTPAPSLLATDINNNFDADYSGTVSLSTTGTFAASATTTTSAVNGVVTFSNLLFSVAGMDLTITSVSGLIEDTSAFFDIANAPTVYSYNNGWTPSDPSGVSTIFDDIAIVGGTASITAPTIIKDVTIASGTALSINAPSALTAVGDAVNNGTITMVSTSVAYPSLITNAITGSGTVTYNRHVNTGAVNGVGGNDLISAPLSGQAFSAFKLNNGNIITNAAGTLNLFGPFEKSSGTFLTYSNDEGASLDAGVGYRAASTGGGFEFTGTVNTGSIGQVITYSASGTPFRLWNLIGNPYTSYISLANFLNENTSELNPNFNAVYGYDDSETDYAIWDLAYSAANPDALIAPGQGFFVAAQTTGDTTVLFTPDMRRTGDTDDFIMGRSNIDYAYFQLTANISGNNRKADFYFFDTTTSGMDIGYDTGFFGGAAPSKAIYSRLVDGSSTIDLANQSLAYDALGSDIIIPIGIKAAQGEQVSVSIAAAQLPTSIEVYLEDIVANTYTFLSNSDYTFTANTALTGTGRFFLRFNDQTLSTVDSALNALTIYASTAQKLVYIKGMLSQTSNMLIYDLQGRQVASSPLKVGINSQSVDVSNLTSGVYIVQLNDGIQKKVQKIIFN